PLNRACSMKWQIPLSCGDSCREPRRTQIPRVTDRSPGMCSVRIVRPFGSRVVLTWSIIDARKPDSKSSGKNIVRRRKVAAKFGSRLDFCVENLSENGRVCLTSRRALAENYDIQAGEGLPCPKSGLVGAQASDKRSGESNNRIWVQFGECS